MLKKLRIKFVAFTMALVCLLLCVIFGMVYSSTARQVELDRLDMMHSLAGRPELPGQKRLPVRDTYLILRQSPKGEWSVQGSDYFDLKDWDFLNTLIQKTDAQEQRDGVLTEYNLRYLKTDQPHKQFVFLDVSEEQAALGHLVRNLVIIGILSMLVFFGIILLLVNLALRPVEKAWQEQTQFVADASHELKTPLAVIMTNAELLQSEDYDRAQRQHFEKNILTKACQMRHLVEGLLELARLDNVAPQLHPLNFSALTETVLLPFEPMFFECGLTLQSSITPGLRVNGSESHLQQVVEVFLDNVLKYSMQGIVTVSVKPAGNYALLQVENPGTPLSADEAEKIFLRFYRMDPARSPSGSYGLGLSIAKKIVQEHGGKIWATGTQTGNCFSVLLPLSRSE